MATQIRVKTENIVPGFYYFVKPTKTSAFEVCYATDIGPFGKMSLHFCRAINGGQLNIESVFAIHTDEAGNPIPVTMDANKPAPATGKLTWQDAFRQAAKEQSVKLFEVEDILNAQAGLNLHRKLIIERTCELLLEAHTTKPVPVMSWDEAKEQVALNSSADMIFSWDMLVSGCDKDVLEVYLKQVADLLAASREQAAVEKMQQDAHLLITRYASNIASNCQNPHHASIEILRMENPFKHHDWKERAARKGIQI